MAERMKPKEDFLELDEQGDLQPEHLDSQVQKAQEQLLQLKRQQEQIEKQKRELEELSKRQEQLQQGREEMIEKFTRALVVLERETYDAEKRVEQLKGIRESFLHHLGTLEAINPKNWESAEINKELSKSLSAVDDARAEYSRSRVIVNADAQEEVLEDTPEHGGYAEQDTLSQHNFAYWLKSGFAFTLPLLLVGLAILIVLIMGTPAP
jgi:DNA repair exonuclease SbcCD ATPase subunit